MQQWADLLDAIKAKDKKVLRGRFGKAAQTKQRADAERCDQRLKRLSGQTVSPARRRTCASSRHRRAVREAGLDYAATQSAATATAAISASAFS